MAKYTFEFDSVTKKMQCWVDGEEKPLPNSVSLYKREKDNYSMHVSMEDEYEDQDVEVYTTITANELIDVVKNVNL